MKLRYVLLGGITLTAGALLLAPLRLPPFSRPVSDGESVPGVSSPTVLDPKPPKELLVVARSEPSTAAPDFTRSSEDLFDQPDSAEKLAALDELFSHFIQSDHVPRAEKLSALLGLARKRSGNQALYVIDNLALLHPLERSSDLIEMFSASSDNQFRHHILAALHGCLTIDTPDQGEQTNTTERATVGQNAILSFAHQLAMSDAPEARYAILEFTPLQPPEVREEIMRSLTDDRLSKVEISSSQYGSLAFDIAVTDPQEESIARLWERFDASVLESDPEFVARALSTLEQVGADPRYHDLARNSVARLGELVLYPELFVKAKYVDMAIIVVPEGERLPSLRQEFRSGIGSEHDVQLSSKSKHAVLF